MTAAALVSGGLAVGRRALDREIEQRVAQAIDEAHLRASADLDTAIRDLIRQRLAGLAVSLSIKAMLIASAFVLYVAGPMTADGFRIVTGFLVAGFVVRDLVAIAPYLGPAMRYARLAGWRPREALRRFVAGLVFERAYAEARAETQRGRNRLWIALSSHRDEAISRRVAERVSRMAVETSFARARSRALLAAASALVMSATYGGFAFLALRAA